jgi:anaerobic magnesium-protoporphyrin IX monomethyl ester cyclase
VNSSVSLILLNPLFSYASRSIYKAVSHFDPPLGLLQLSAFLNENSFNTLVFDLNVEIRDNDELERFTYLIKEKHCIDENTIFGIPFVTTFAKNAFELAKELKQLFPENKIVAGGAHASFMCEEVLSNQFIDMVIRGEGEYPMLELLQKKPLETIKGISYKKLIDGKLIIKHNANSDRIKDINTLPFPDYEQLKVDKYRPVLGSYKSLPAMNMVTSRGCPGKCTFCCRTFGNYTTYLSSEKVFANIKILVKKYGIKQINFYDDTFTIKKQRVLDLCNLLIVNDIKIDWTCFARIDSVDEEMLKTMKKAGCYQIMYGVENFNQSVLNDINKNINTERIQQVVSMTKKHKINCRISLLIGNPLDTPEIIKYNIKQLRKLKPDILVVNITTPFPGTEIYRWAEKEKRLITYDWSQFDGKQAVMRIDGLSSDQIYMYYHKMYFNFYFRFSYIVSRFKELNNFTAFKMYIKGFFLLIGFILKRIFNRK